MSTARWASPAPDGVITQVNRSVTHQKANGVIVFDQELGPPLTFGHRHRLFCRLFGCAWACGKKMETKPGGQDRTRINVNEPYELRDWSEKFGVSPDLLKEAVAAVGTSAAAVEAHLKSR